MLATTVFGAHHLSAPQAFGHMKRLITDPHFHLWAPTTHSWLKDKASLSNHPAGDMNPVGRDYNMHEFLSESDKYDLDKSVHVQCYHDDPLQETRSLQSIADNTTFSGGHPHGIIAYAELESPDIESTVTKQMEFTNFRGIRQCIDYHPKYENRRLCPRDDLMADPAFHRGLQVMAEHNLVFDLQLYPIQLFAASVMAAAHPTLSIVINHCGFPMLSEEPCWEWIKGLMLMANNDNVFIKLSGWGIVDQHFDKMKMKHIIKTVIDIFGVDRCLFASDFPVDKIHGEYDMYWDLYIEILEELGYDEDDIDKMIHRNAIRVYKLKNVKQQGLSEEE